MKVAIFGSEEYKIKKHVASYVKSLPDGDVVISGAGSGVDRIAELTAKKRGLQVEIYAGDWSYQNKSLGYVRTRDVVLLADRVVAFWDGKSRGTPRSVSFARDIGKEMLVFGPQGEILYDSKREPLRDAV